MLKTSLIFFVFGFSAFRPLRSGLPLLADVRIQTSKSLRLAGVSGCSWLHTKLFRGQFAAVRAFHYLHIVVCSWSGWRISHFWRRNCLSKTSVLFTYLHGFITGKINQDSKFGGRHPVVLLLTT